MTARPLSSELTLRIYSALTLIVLTLAITYAGPQLFAALIILFAGLMSWEWGRVVRQTSFDRIFALQALTTACAGVLTLMHYPVAALGLIVGATIAAFFMHRLSDISSDAWWSAAGVYYSSFPTVSLIAIRQDATYGFHAVLYIFLIVWSADTGAFFAGRLIGGAKLAPIISPNKTWSGFIGGALAATATGLVFAAWLGKTSMIAIGLLSFILSLCAQGGDLVESALKRVFGIKDSSSLIPGHGGVLDRLDGLVFAAIGAGLLAVTVDPMKPGKALLVW